MKRASTCLFFGLVVFAFNSCRVPSAPVETTNIHGRVELAQYPVLLTPPFRGVTVALEGTSYSAVTDDTGYFTIHNVPTGTYNIRFSKPGFGDVRWMSTTVAGGGNGDMYLPDQGSWLNRYSVALYRVSKVVTALDALRFLDTTFMLQSGSDARGPMFMASGNVVPDVTRPQSEGAMALYVSHTSDVSAQPGHYTIFFYGSIIYNNGPSATTAVTAPIDTTTGRFHFLIMKSWLNYFGFNSGDSIYVAAYGAPSSYGMVFGDYYDPIVQQYVLTAFNQTPSPVIGTVMP